MLAGELHCCLSLENAIVQKCIFSRIFVAKLVNKQQNLKPAFH